MAAGALALVLHVVAGPLALFGAGLGALGLASPGKGLPNEALSLGASFVVLVLLLKVLGMAVNVLILRRLGRQSLHRLPLPSGAARVLRWVLG